MRKETKNLLIFQGIGLSPWCVFVLTAVIGMACSTVQTGGGAQVITNPARVNSADKRPTPSSSPQSPIRSIDFANFTYPARPIYRFGEAAFTLKNGRYQGRIRLAGGQGPFGDPYPLSLVGVVYGDATSDSEEDAMVILSERVAGTAIPYYVYVFGMTAHEPRALWSFAAGDRGDGGLRKVYAESGMLVVELYGKDTRVGDIRDKQQDTAACCPKSFTRTRYVWKRNRFVQWGLPEVLPNPLNNAELLLG